MPRFVQGLLRCALVYSVMMSSFKCLMGREEDADIEDRKRPKKAINQSAATSMEYAYSLKKCIGRLKLTMRCKYVEYGEIQGD